MFADSNTCRLAFHGRIVSVIDPHDSCALQVIQRLPTVTRQGGRVADKGRVCSGAGGVQTLKVYKPKLREGSVDRVRMRGSTLAMKLLGDQ